MGLGQGARDAAAEVGTQPTSVSARQRSGRKAAARPCRPLRGRPMPTSGHARPTWVGTATDRRSVHSSQTVRKRRVDSSPLGCCCNKPSLPFLPGVAAPQTREALLRCHGERPPLLPGERVARAGINPRAGAGNGVRQVSLPPFPREGRGAFSNPESHPKEGSAADVGGRANGPRPGQRRRRGASREDRRRPREARETVRPTGPWWQSPSGATRQAFPSRPVTAGSAATFGREGRHLAV